MNFVTVPVLSVVGNEHKAIDEAILKGLQVLSEEIGGGPVVLSGVIPVVIPGPPSPRVYVTVVAQPYVVAEQEQKGDKNAV